MKKAYIDTGMDVAVVSENGQAKFVIDWSGRNLRDRGDIKALAKSLGFNISFIRVDSFEEVLNEMALLYAEEFGEEWFA